MESYPFFFIGHGVGTLSGGFDAHLLFVEKPSDEAKTAIQQRLQGYGEIRWSDHSASFCLSDRQIQSALKHDPSYDDRPECLNDPEVYETFALSPEGVKEIQKRLIHYYYDFQHELREINKDNRVVLCIVRQDPKAKLTPWHSWSEQQLEVILDILLDYYHRDDVRRERFNGYSEVSFFDSNAVILCQLIETVIRRKSDVKKVSEAVSAKLIEVIKSAVGFSDNT
ncbi:hypothetical protein [Hahella ganghwensis]|uniref:hypothetical protein n=1 Tax=Hahella ganghwensis TaxID=286420 RepID=UPI000365D8D1|nr:hypothetical protein [Hahella ganghwensis]